jgi:hypothetical protein
VPASNVFKNTVGHTTLAKFTAHVAKLKPAEANKLRSALLKEFKSLVEYKDATEWARAVTVCEALAVVGWGKKERVDAIAHFNGDCWETYFVNARGEKRFLESRWSKRKKGWQPFNPEYHWSPDRPQVAEVDWRQYRQKLSPPVDREELPSQSNYLRQTPIIMGMFGGVDPVSLCVAQLKMELDALFTLHLRPNEYGLDLEFFYFTLHCPYLNAQNKSRLKIGALRSKERAFSCDLYFATGFDALQVKEQKEYFRRNLRTALDRLESTLRKKKLTYDVPALREDIEAAFQDWLSGEAN